MIRNMGMGALLALGLSAFLTTDAAAQGGRGGGMMGGRGFSALLSNEGVQKELKLDDDQIAKAKELTDKLREKRQEAMSGLQGLDQQERMQKIQEFTRELNATAKKDAGEFLKADQLARLVQIDYQTRGPAAFSDPEVAAKLKVTDEQKTAIKEIEDESRKEMMSVFQSAANGGNREEAMAKMAELQKSTREKVEGKLTDDQKKTWKELIGAPFEVKFAPRQRQNNN